MFKTHLMRGAAAFAILLASPGLGLAAETGAASDAVELETLVVTAQTQEQKLIDVPINISVADQAKLDLLGADQIESFADFVPGLEVQAQSLNAPSYALRGVTSDGGRPRVALFQNGVASSFPRYGANLAMYDLERIEVVKGPQATLFGQGALVGGINFLQNRASLAGTSGEVKLDGGNYNYMKAEGFYNAKVDETLAVRLAGQYRSRDGYVKSLGNTPDLMGQKTTAARMAVHWEPISRLTGDLWLNYQYDNSTGTQFKSGTFAPAGGDLSPFTATAMNVNPDQQRTKLGNDRTAFTGTARFVYQLNDAWKLTSISDYRSLKSFEAFDSDGTLVNLLQFGYDENAHVLNQEVRLNYDAGGRISAFMGANYSRLRTSERLRFSTDEANLQALFAPQIAGAVKLSVAQLKGALIAKSVPGAANFDNVINPMKFSALGALQGQLIPTQTDHLEEQTSNANYDTKDVFGDVTFRVTDKLALTGGLRWTEESLHSDALAYLLKGNPFLGGKTNAIFFTTTVLVRDDKGVARKRDFDTKGSLTWRFNAAYKLNDDINTWLAVGRGRRPEALSPQASEPTGFQVVREETLDNVELGMSALFLRNRARVTSSIYYGEYKDFQTTRFEPKNGTFITENSGNATQYGFEFEGDALLTEHVQVFGSYAFNHSRYDDTDGKGNKLQYAGNMFRLSPEHNVSLGGEFKWQAPMGGEIYVVPTYNWKSKMFFEDDNDPKKRQDAYGVVDLKVGYRADAGTWGASVWVNNALDEEFIVDAGNTGGAFGIPTYIRGLPRMFGANLFLKY